MTMVQSDGQVVPARPPGSRTLVVSFLGAVVHRLGGWMPIGGVIDLLTQAGLDAQSVRTAVFRLKRRGWLVAESRSGVRGYALTQTSLAALAAGDEIIWHSPPPADLADGWCIVSFSVPESARAERHQLRSRLAGLGFGNVGSGTWIAPARRRPLAEAAIGDLGLLPRCAIFVGEYAGGEPLLDLVADSWDLTQIDDRYRRFVTQCDHEAVLTAPGATDGQEAFVTYLRVVDHWRRLPYRDPGLPAEVLPPGWSAAKAGELFERLVADLEDAALGHARGYWPSSGLGRAG